MPQLDIGIFFVEFFLNFFCFWLIYLLKAKKIFPSLNKSIKLRKYKIKKINNFLFLYFNNFNFLNNYLKNNKIIFESLTLKNLNVYFLKLKIIYFLILKNYNNSFLLKNNKFFNNFLNKQVIINKI
jgi:hypothetical protein